MTDIVFGLSSAASEAERIGLGNMEISAPLVLELCHKILEQQNALDGVVTEYCDRDEYEVPLYSNEQSCPFIREAQRVLNGESL